MAAYPQGPTPVFTRPVVIATGLTGPTGPSPGSTGPTGTTGPTGFTGPVGSFAGVRSSLTYVGPTGSFTTSENMAGLGASITPGSSGNVLLLLAGVGESITTGYAQFNIRYGTGAAPVALAAASGTVAGQQLYAGPGINFFPFTCIGYVSGLTPHTTYWVDLGIVLTAGSCQLGYCTVIAIEV